MTFDIDLGLDLDFGLDLDLSKIIDYAPGQTSLFLLTIKYSSSTTGRHCDFNLAQKTKINLKVVADCLQCARHQRFSKDRDQLVFIQLFSYMNHMAAQGLERRPTKSRVTAFLYILN